MVCGLSQHQLILQRALPAALLTQQPWSLPHATPHFPPEGPLALLQRLQLAGPAALPWPA